MTGPATFWEAQRERDARLRADLIAARADAPASTLDVGGYVSAAVLLVSTYAGIVGIAVALQALVEAVR